MIDSDATITVDIVDLAKCCWCKQFHFNGEARRVGLLNDGSPVYACSASPRNCLKLYGMAEELYHKSADYTNGTPMDVATYRTTILFG